MLSTINQLEKKRVSMQGINESSFVNAMKFIRNHLLLRSSHLFNEKWYTGNYPEVRRTHCDPITHYLLYGGWNGYDPSHLFNSREYLVQYPDVEAAGVNPLVHYLLHGKKEERKIKPGIPVRQVTDEEWIQYAYEVTFHRPLNLKNPRGLNEKIQAYKLYYRNPELPSKVDKFAVREYVANTIGKKYLIPMIGVYENIEQINIDQLPERFAMKATHGSGWNIICTDKQSFDWEQCKQTFSFWLKNNYYDVSKEWAYKDIPPRILVEEFIGDSSGKVPPDYKFFCFSGEPRFIQVDYDRFGDHTAAFYSTRWKRLPLRKTYPNYKGKEGVPHNFMEMLDLVKRLADNYPFVRVDLYSSTSIYFGELTFYPASGLGRFSPKRWDKIFGRYFTDLGFLPAIHP